MIDYHLHTVRCCHATGTMEEYLDEAVKKRIGEVGFADHFPLGLLGVNPRSQVTMNPEELEGYINEVLDLRSRYREIEVKLGIEIDYLPGSEEKVEQLLQQYPFDYVIGSIHFMGDWDFTHPVYAETYRERNIEELYSIYFGLVQDLCRSRLFDIVGHIDVIKKFGYRPGDGKALEKYWLETAETLKSTETAFEINTAGFDAPVGAFYPDRGMVESCFKAGVPCTLGSDAHTPDQVGRYFAEALELARSAGYSELATFSGRTRGSMRI